MSTNNTALQITNFNFYGDELIALKDNATGEIYTSINSVLRGIGFKDEQVRYQRGKWIKDKSISKGVLKFNIPSNGGNQLTECIITSKLPLALAKINITKRLERDYPNITNKLELYQDKCADVLVSVFIDHKSTDQFTMQPILNTLDNFTKTVNDTLLSLNERMSKLEEQSKKQKIPEMKYSRWKKKTFDKLNSLLSYVNKNSGENLSLPNIMHLVINETEDIYDIEMNEYAELYRCEFCIAPDIKIQVLDVINHYKDVRDMFTLTLDSIMGRLHIAQKDDKNRMRNIFDELAGGNGSRYGEVNYMPHTCSN